MIKNSRLLEYLCTHNNLERIQEMRYKEVRNTGSMHFDPLLYQKSITTLHQGQEILEKLYTRIAKKFKFTPNQKPTLSFVDTKKVRNIEGYIRTFAPYEIHAKPGIVGKFSYTLTHEIMHSIWEQKKGIVQKIKEYILRRNYSLCEEGVVESLAIRTAESLRIFHPRLASFAKGRRIQHLLNADKVIETKLEEPSYKINITDPNPLGYAAIQLLSQDHDQDIAQLFFDCKNL